MISIFLQISGNVVKLNLKVNAIGERGFVALANALRYLAITIFAELVMLARFRCYLV
jgi:hypothetical protein